MVGEQCGSAADRSDVTLTLEAPPLFSGPSDGTTIAKDAEFAWSSFDDGIYMLQLNAQLESAASPRIDVFTVENKAVWPDLSGIGAVFPAAAAYQCFVVGLGPYASMDEALGLTGLGAPFPVETRRSYSTMVGVTTTSP
jgi:hypothetical protein